MLEIATVEQDRLLRGPVGPVRIWIIERGGGLASGKAPCTGRLREVAEDGDGGCGERAEAEK